MTLGTCRQLRQVGLVMLLAITLAGCASPFGSLASQRKASVFRDPATTMQIARESVVLGQSTKDAVAAVLGPADVVRFDSGYEVWLYRESAASETATPAEFVILFAPSGVAKKTRLLPAS